MHLTATLDQDRVDPPIAEMTQQRSEIDALTVGWENDNLRPGLLKEPPSRLGRSLRGRDHGPTRLTGVEHRRLDRCSTPAIEYNS